MGQLQKELDERHGLGLRPMAFIFHLPGGNLSLISGEVLQCIEILPLEKQKIFGALVTHVCHRVEPLGIQLCGKAIFLLSQVYFGWPRVTVSSTDDITFLSLLHGRHQ